MLTSISGNGQFFGPFLKFSFILNWRLKHDISAAQLMPMQTRVSYRAGMDVAYTSYALEFAP
jgi:hypothetical protein